MVIVLGSVSSQLRLWAIYQLILFAGLTGLVRVVMDLVDQVHDEGTRRTVPRVGVGDSARRGCQTILPLEHCYGLTEL